MCSCVALRKRRESVGGDRAVSPELSVDALGTAAVGNRRVGAPSGAPTATRWPISVVPIRSRAKRSTRVLLRSAVRDHRNEALRRLVWVGVALVLLNGPPASGKSTLAGRLVSLRPLALNLDIDLVRGQLGGWLEKPVDAGLAARAMAISMIDTHLGSGYDVVVPQLLARPDFIEQLEEVAAAAGAEFVEIALDVTKAVAISAFEERRLAPTHSTHRDASALVERSQSADPVADMYDALQLLLDTRPGCHRIEAPRGDIDKTLTSIRCTLSDHGIDW